MQIRGRGDTSKRKRGLGVLQVNKEMGGSVSHFLRGWMDGEWIKVLVFFGGERKG